MDEAKQDADTQALRKLNDFIAKDTRVEAVMLGVADPHNRPQESEAGSSPPTSERDSGGGRGRKMDV